MRSARPKVLFTVGVGRSGSTIIDQILGQIDGFCSIGELQAIWAEGLIAQDTCGCGETVTTCPFWRSVFADAFGGVEKARPAETAALLDAHLRTRPRQLTALWRDVRRNHGWSPARAYGDILHRLYVAVSRASRSRVVVDSTKLPAHALVASAFANVDLYVLHVVRDPRAVAHSWSRNPDPSGRRSRSNLGFKGMGLVRSAAQWTFFGLTIESVLRPRLGDHYLLVRYEDFAARPTEVTKRILEFLGEEPAGSPFVDERNVRLGDNHMVVGNRARFRRGIVPVRIDEDWKGSMPVRARVVCTLLTWPLLPRYGYRVFSPGA